VSLIAIKQQIKSTKNTRKITKAMQLVAASKMKKFQKIAEHTTLFARELIAALDETRRSIEDTVYGAKKDGDALFVLLTSDKGLCGAMNSRLERHLFRSELWKNAEEKRKLVTVGKKSLEIARREGVKPLATFVQVNEEMGAKDALDIINEIITPFVNGEVGEVHLIAPHYVNAFTFEPRIKKMLPLSEELVGAYASETTELSEVDAAYFEPSREEAAEGLALQLVQSLFFEAFYELKATEYSSRMVAMKQATEAADDQITALTAKFNKARQSAITRELSELAAANDAMSDQNHYEIIE
jgi:F-type H+-transporting ATPase subunit gamma